MNVRISSPGAGPDGDSGCKDPFDYLARGLAMQPLSPGLVLTWRGAARATGRCCCTRLTKLVWRIAPLFSMVVEAIVTTSKVRLCVTAQIASVAG